MPITITFTTDTLTKDEAVGLFALLDTIRPDAFDPGPELSTDTISRVTRELMSEVSQSHVQMIQEESVAPVEDQIAPTPPDAPERDSRGLPWHADIHASSKALNADGTWRTKRGVDKALVASVEAELRTAATPFEGVNDDPDELERVEDEVKELLATAPAIVPPPPPPAARGVALPETVTLPPPAPPNAPAAATSPFVALMKRVTTAQSAGKLTQPRVKELLESMEKKSIMDLRTDEDAQAAFGLLLDGEGV